MVVLGFLRARLLLSISSQACKSSACQSYRGHAEEAPPRTLLHHGSLFCRVGHPFNLSFSRVDRSVDARNDQTYSGYLDAFQCKAHAKPGKSRKRAACRDFSNKLSIDRAEPCHSVDTLSGDGLAIRSTRWRTVRLR